MSSDAKYGAPTTRARILDAALEVVAEQGSGMMLGDIASRAGVSRQAVYLHFGDRTGLLVALVQHMDDQLQLEDSLRAVFASESSSELIEQTMNLHSNFSAAIDSVALVLEGAQYEDEALGTAWRDRMNFRHEVHRQLIERIAAVGDLADGWTIETAADLFYAVTLPGPWRELTRELGWSQDQYIAGMTHLLQRALLRRGEV